MCLLLLKLSVYFLAILVAQSFSPFNIIRRTANKPSSASSSSCISLASSNTGSQNCDRDCDYDLAVIGGGVVGVQAALAAAASSKKVCLIDAPRESGVLMNEDEDLSIGAPTGLFGKALRDTSKRIKVSTLRGMGLREDSIWNEIINSCVDLASSNAQDIMRQLEDSGVEYIEGLASFADDGGSSSLFVAKADMAVETVTAQKVLIATGSSPFRQGGVPFDAKRIFDSDSINQVRLAFCFCILHVAALKMLFISPSSSTLFLASIFAQIHCYYRIRYYCS